MVVRLFKLRYLFLVLFTVNVTHARKYQKLFCVMSQIYLSCHVLDFRRKFSSNFFSFLFFSIDTLPLNVLLVLLFCFIQWLSVLHALCITSCQLLTYRDLSWKLLTVLEVYKKFKVWYLFLLKAILLTVCTLGLSVLHQREPQWQWPVLFFATDWFSN